jgi:peptidoglycan/xylan/chitin deacetylase (PgdA/CDA1 family)/murein DD-endopeptidase MepM/ murein hydrolase activator NlpD
LLIRTVTLTRRARRATAVACAAALCLTLFFALGGVRGMAQPEESLPAAWHPGELIKWVDFSVPCEVMEKALKLDVESHAADGPALDWVELLSYLAAKYWGDFGRFRDRDLAAVADALRGGAAIDTLTAEMNLYPYYREAYDAVLGGLVGPYRVAVVNEAGEEAWEERYGLKAFSPIASGFPFSHYSDFGASRSYGYDRLHLGHDMMAQVGTPIIAVETGVVEELGWNQYGGWRVGLRSLDGKRYYYYAHMRQNRPYSAGLEKGQTIYAGAVIGYVGRTGYSVKENVNNIKQSHLHWGLQIIFDESQKEGANEIWVDVYEITKLLQKNKSKTVRDPETKEYTRAVPFEEPPPPDQNTGGGDAPPSVTVPLIMYHSILKARSNKYVIAPAQLEADLKYLSENGWHTIVMADLIRFADEGTPLPDKPILLTFDDGYYNNIHYAQPLLEEYGMKGVLAVVGAFTDKSTAEGTQNPNYSYLSWDTIRETAEKGVFEIQSHSYNMHTQAKRQGCLRRPGENTEDYGETLLDDLNRLSDTLEETMGCRPTTFVYPFGLMSVESERVLRQAGFRASFSCSEGVNQLVPGDAEGLYRLNRCIRTPNMSVQNILKRYGLE